MSLDVNDKVGGPVKGLRPSSIRDKLRRMYDELYARLCESPSKKLLELWT